MTTLLTQSRARYPDVDVAHHSFFTSLVEDMVITVFDHLPVDTLVRFRSAAPVADVCISVYLQKRLVGHLRCFVEDPLHFLDELEFSCSVISGSSALAILCRHSWEPQDLDIYTPRDFFWHVVAYLVHVENYTPEFLTKLDYAEYGNVRSVARLSRADGRQVDVIQSQSNSPLLPIASFWTTAVMNYVTPTSFCIAYPHLTDELRALTTTTMPAEDGIAEAVLPRMGVDLVHKYELRGFAVRTDHLSWAQTDNPSATCPGQGTAHCPLTMCYFGDRYCVTGAIPSV